MQKRVEIGEISPGKVREIVKLTVQIKKPGQPTYLNEYKVSLVFAPADIEGSHCLPFEFQSVAMQFHKVVKSVKSRFGDNDFLQKSSMRYLQEVIKQVNKNENEHEYQKHKIV